MGREPCSRNGISDLSSFHIKPEPRFESLWPGLKPNQFPSDKRRRVFSPFFNRSITIISLSLSLLPGASLCVYEWSSYYYFIRFHLGGMPLGRPKQSWFSPGYNYSGLGWNKFNSHRTNGEFFPFFNRSITIITAITRVFRPALYGPFLDVA